MRQHLLKPKTDFNMLEDAIERVAKVKPTDYEGIEEFSGIVPPSSPVAPQAPDVFVAVSSADESAGYLDDELDVGTCLKKAILNPGDNEVLEIGLEIDNGSGFPGSPEDWQLYYNTDDDLLYIYVPGSGYGWEVVGAGGIIDPGTAPGQLLYWDTVSGKWVASDIEYLGYNDAIYQLMIGNSNNPGVLRSLYTHQYFDGGALALGTIGTQDSGILPSALYTTGTPLAFIHKDRAADTALTHLIATAGSTLNVDNLANRYNWLMLQESPGHPAGVINYNTSSNELFQEADYLSLLGAAYIKTYDRNWAGATRNEYCGLTAITPVVPPGIDVLNVTFANALPDAKYAVALTGRYNYGMPTHLPGLPSVTVDVTLSVGAKGTTGFSAKARYTTTMGGTNIGLASVLGPGLDVCDNYAVLVAAALINPPNNTLNGAGLDMVNWIVRRYF